MSWVRFGEVSDLYVFEHVDGFWVCAACLLTEGHKNHEEPTEIDMAYHVLRHAGRGHKVPYSLIDECLKAVLNDER